MHSRVSLRIVAVGSEGRHHPVTSCGGVARVLIYTDKQLLDESTVLRNQVADQQKQIIILRHDASQGRSSADPVAVG